MGKHKKKKRDEDLKKLKHYDTFYASAPPGLIKEHRERSEDTIPDIPENKKARDFLANAPEKGLWMPLGKEVKVMRCWRCKLYGHRTGDRECPLFLSGNVQTDRFRWSHEDPMHNYMKDQTRTKKEDRVKELQMLLENSSSSDSSESSDDSSDSEAEHRKKRKRKKMHSKSKCSPVSDIQKHSTDSDKDTHDTHKDSNRNKHKHHDDIYDNEKKKHKLDSNDKSKHKKNKHDSDSYSRHTKPKYDSDADEDMDEKHSKHRHKKHRKEKHKKKHK